MSENRAAKSGLARDVQNKINSKFDESAAELAMQWLAKVTGEPLNTTGTVDNVYAELNDGYVLALLANKIKEGTIAPRHLAKRPTLVFKKAELIELFTRFIKGDPLGVPEAEIFATCDLTEKQNMPQVIICLAAVARKCQTRCSTVEGYGPKESEANKREFTQEQLAQGKSIIGLQMGSNKGASQSGQNFGKSRMIVD